MLHTPPLSQLYKLRILFSPRRARGATCKAERCDRRLVVAVVSGGGSGAGAGGQGRSSLPCVPKNSQQHS